VSLFLEEVGNPITEDRELFYSKTFKNRKFGLDIKLTSHTIEPIIKIQAESNV
jgi:hypothetical protein